MKPLTFTEIGKREGISASYAFVVYQRAMAKLELAAADYFYLLEGEQNQCLSGSSKSASSLCARSSPLPSWSPRAQRRKRQKRLIASGLFALRATAINGD